MTIASTLSTVAHIFKYRYDDKRLANQAMRDHALFQAIAKEGGFTGKSWYYSINYGNPQGIGATVAAAQASASSSQGVQPLLTRKKKYGIITLDGEAIAACEDDGALADLVRFETDNAINEMGDELAFDLFRNGTGVRGRRQSLNGNIIQLTDPNDARNFKIGMTIVSDDVATGASLNAGNTTVTKVNLQAGQITVANAAAMVGFQDNDYLFRYSTPGTCIEGLAYCTPLVAPVNGDNFRTIDRSVDVERLAGYRLNDTNLPIEEAIQKIAAEVSAGGKRQDRYYVHPTPFHTAARRLSSRIEYTGGGGNAGVGFETITVSTSAGNVQLIADADCQTDLGWGVKMDQHAIKHLKGMIHLVQDDSLESMRQASDDGIEKRLRFMGNYLQRTPGAFSTFAIGS